MDPLLWIRYVDTYEVVRLLTATIEEDSASKYVNGNYSDLNIIAQGQ